MSASLLLLVVASSSTGLAGMLTARALGAPGWSVMPIGLLCATLLGHALAIRLFPNHVEYTLRRALPYLLGGFLIALLLDWALPGGR